MDRSLTVAALKQAARRQHDRSLTASGSETSGSETTRPPPDGERLCSVVIRDGLPDHASVAATRGMPFRAAC